MMIWFYSQKGQPPAHIGNLDNPLDSTEGVLKSARQARFMSVLCGMKADDTQYLFASEEHMAEFIDRNSDHLTPYDVAALQASDGATKRS